MAARQPSPIKEWRDVDSATFAREIVARNEPAVIRGVANDWPMVRHFRGLRRWSTI
jgi:hypothetical protein